MFAKEGILLSDAAAVESPPGVVRAVNWLSHPQADVSLVRGCPVSTPSRKLAAQKGSWGVEAVRVALEKF